MTIIGHTVKAQSFSEILNKVMENYNAVEAYSVDATYTMYVDNVSMQEKDKQTSKLIKQGDNYYFKMANSEIIMTKSFYLKISHSERMLLYSKVDVIDNSVFESQIPFLQILDKFENKEVKDKGSYWECSISKSNELKLPYDKIIFQVSKKNHHIKKQIYYFNTSVEKKFIPNSSNTKKERLEIVINGLDKKPIIDENLFNLNKYLDINDTSITSSEYTKNYKILVQ